MDSELRTFYFELAQRHGYKVDETEERLRIQKKSQNGRYFCLQGPEEFSDTSKTLILFGVEKDLSGQELIDQSLEILSHFRFIGADLPGMLDRFQGRLRNLGQPVTNRNLRYDFDFYERNEQVCCEYTVSVAAPDKKSMRALADGLATILDR